MSEIEKFDKNSENMSSVYIALITGKRHADILRAITKMLNQLEISQRTFAFTYTDEQGKLRPCYNLPKRECLILASGFNIKLRAAIIDRWAELETEKIKNNNFSDIEQNFINKIQYEAKLNEIAGFDISWTRKYMLEEGTKLEQETGLKILNAALLQTQIGIPTFDLDQTLPAHAAKVAIGSNFTNVSQWAKSYTNLTSTDINKVLRERGYSIKINLSQYIPTEKGKEFSNTATSSSGKSIGKPIIKGWNLEDKRFTKDMFPVLDELNEYNKIQSIMRRNLL